MLLKFILADIARGFEDRTGQKEHSSSTTGTGKPTELACWLDASPSGLKLYQQLGWKEVGESEFSLEQWGGQKGQIHKNVHIRPECWH